MMKKLLERNEFLIYLCQQIIQLLLDHRDKSKPFITPPPVFMSVQDVADKCFVTTRQVRRWVDADKIVPQKYIGSSPYFALDYIDNALETGVLRMRKRRGK